MNQLTKEFYVIFNDEIWDSRPIFVGDETQIVYMQPQSKTLKTTTNYYTKSGNIYTLVTEPTQADLNANEYWIKGYKGNITLYFKAINQNEEEINYQTNVKISLTDYLDHEGVKVEIIYAMFAMLDFLPGGHGMAIGQASFQEGLVINLPTLIGEELIPPYRTNTLIPTQDHLVVNGKNYYNATGTIISSPLDSDVEEYYEKVSAVDLNQRQLVLGKYNIPDYTEANAQNYNFAYLLIGNGTDKNNRSNLFRVDATGITVDQGIKFRKTDSIYTNLQVGTPTANRTITLPNKSGTIALTSDVGVTSVAITGSNGITISNSPITSIGTITVGLNLSTAINGLGEGTSPAQLDDYAVVQYADGGTTTTTYHRRKLSNLIVGKAVADQNGLRIDTGYLKLTGGTVTGATNFNSSVSIDSLTAGNLIVNGNASVTNDLNVGGLINKFKINVGTGIDANNVRTTNGMWISPASITNAAITNHGVLMGFANVGTPFQLYVADSTHQYIYKRSWDSTNSVWRDWAKLSAGYADSAGSATDSTKLPLAGGTMTGDLLFANSDTTTRQIRGIVGSNDYWRVAGGATAGNAGWMEIATADDGNEPIYVRQYTGAYTTITRTLTLLDTSGNTTLPGILTLYREGTTANNYPASINFSVKDTTTGITDNNAYIHVYEDHATSAYGTNMVLQSGGGMFIGGGESPGEHYNQKGSSYTGEDIFITTDGIVYLQANGNTIANRLGMALNTAHQLIPIKADTYTNNVGSIGTSDYKWNAIYATTFYGSLSGNATSADATVLPRMGNANTIDSKSAPSQYRAKVQEYGPSCLNLPTSAWYFIQTWRGADNTYCAQLALGETTDDAYFRILQNNSWGSWRRITTGGRNITMSTSNPSGGSNGDIWFVYV